MYIELNNDQDGIPCLRLIENVCLTSTRNLTVTETNVIFDLGPLSLYDDGKPFYLDRLNNSFRKGHPLIPDLLPFCEPQEDEEEDYDRFLEKPESPIFVSHPRRFSHFLLEKILEALGLDSFFARLQEEEALSYDLYGYARLLIFDNFYHPSNRDLTVLCPGDYYMPFVSNFDPCLAGDALHVIAGHSRELVQQINNVLIEKTGIPRIIKPGSKGDYCDYYPSPEIKKGYQTLMAFSKALLRVLRDRIGEAGTSPQISSYQGKSMGDRRIREALGKWKVEDWPEGRFRFIYIDDPDVAAIIRAFELDVKPRYYKAEELMAIWDNVRLFP